jgi:hypothetical protein
MTTTRLNLTDLGYTLLDDFDDKPPGTVGVKNATFDWTYYAPPAEHPTLPSLAWTVIRVDKSQNAAQEGRVLTRGVHATWFNAAVQYAQADLQRTILKFTVLAEPVEDEGF